MKFFIYQNFKFKQSERKNLHPPPSKKESLKILSLTYLTDKKNAHDSSAQIYKNRL